MTNELAPIDGQPSQEMVPLSTEKILTRRGQILHIMEHVMKKGTHFDKIPGCPKVSLFQPGAEALNVTFRLGWRHEVIKEVITPDEISVTVKSIIFDQVSQMDLGDALGSCSTSEEKYAWRKSFKEEWDVTPPERRREKWYKPSEKNNWKAQSELQVHTNPADLYNTMLAMASKRGDVRATRGALAASDIFDVNSEDLPVEIREAIFGDDDETRAHTAEQKSKANGMEQRARAGASGTKPPSPTPAPGNNTIDRTAVRDIMQLVEQIVGFTAWDEAKNKNTWTKDAFAFFTQLGVKGKINEISIDVGNKVLTALRERLDMQITEQQSAEGDASEITDPFADQ